MGVLEVLRVLAFAWRSSNKGTPSDCNRIGVQSWTSRERRSKCIHGVYLQPPVHEKRADLEMV